MDFLNKAFAQFNDLFRSMSPGGRVTAGLLLVVAVVSVGYLFQSPLSGGDDYLFSGEAIPGPTLQKMVVAFGEKGLNGFTVEGERLKVPHARRAEYLAVLGQEKLMPPRFGDHMKEAANGSFTDTPKQHDERWRLGKELELSGEIGKWKDIQSASVFINMKPSAGFGQPGLNTAAVSIECIGGHTLDEEQAVTMREYVAAACGMKSEDVTIADASGALYVSSDAGHGGPNSDPYARAARAAERELESKIRRSLAYIPNVTITPTVVLNADKGTRTLESKVDPKAVTVHISEANKESNRDSSSPGGTPGFGAQGGGANTPVSLASTGGKSGSETNKEDKRDETSETSRVVTEKETLGLTPKSAKVSIGIPASYYEKVWREQNPAKEGETAKKPDQTALDAIRTRVSQDVVNHVFTLLPPSEVKDPSALVTVTTFQDIKSAEIAGPAIPQRALSWLGENWPMLAMVGLVLMSVGMLRSALRGASASASDASPISTRISATEINAEEKKEESVEATAARRLRRMTGSGPSLRDELSELVKEDPDSAANILRGWIGQAN